jgi:hypothetical protein
MKRLVSKNGIDFIEAETVGEREILINGKPINHELSISEQNLLDSVIDAFEEGENRLEDNHEVYSYNKFEIRRKVKAVGSIK